MAGGHLAGSLGVLWNNEIIEKYLDIKNEEVKPNAMILCYPLYQVVNLLIRVHLIVYLGKKRAEISRENLSLEKLVSIETPKTFLWHTFDDGTVPVQNSLLFSNALASNKVQFELHIYPSGVHGLGLCEEITAMNGRSEHINSHIASWFNLACQWIKTL